MSKKIRFTRSFTAADDRGKLHRLHLYTEYLIEPDPDTGADEEYQLQGIIKTEKNETVIRTDRGVYEIVVTGIRLRSDDPDAP